MRFWGKGEQVKSISPEAAAGGDVELLPDAKVRRLQGSRADMGAAPLLLRSLAQRVRQCNLRCIGFCPGYTSEMGGRGSKATEQGTQLVQVWVGAGRQLGISARVLRV